MRESGIVCRHLPPNFAGYLIVNVSLEFPSMIMAETALNCLGLGLRSPEESWACCSRIGFERIAIGDGGAVTHLISHRVPADNAVLLFRSASRDRRAAARRTGTGATGRRVPCSRGSSASRPGAGPHFVASRYLTGAETRGRATSGSTNEDNRHVPSAPRPTP